MNKFCWNQSFKKEDCIIFLKNNVQTSALSSSFSWVLLFVKKETFGALKHNRFVICKSTKFIKKRCLYSLNYDFGNIFYNLKTKQFYTCVHKFRNVI